MATLEEENAILERQVEYFRSDDRIRDEVRIWADTTASERLAELESMSVGNEYFLARVDEAALERMRAVDALPLDTIELLEVLRRQSR